MLKVYNLNIASIFPYLHASLEINELGKSSTALQKLGPSISTSELGRHEHFWGIGLTYRRTELKLRTVPVMDKISNTDSDKVNNFVNLVEPKM